MDRPMGYPANPYGQGAQGGTYPNVYAQGNTGYPQHEPECRHYTAGDDGRGRRKDNSFINALAAIFVVCWCCTWPCHGPCCCGL